jgi:hypothetical protein
MGNLSRDNDALRHAADLLVDAQLLSEKIAEAHLAGDALRHAELLNNRAELSRKYEMVLTEAQLGEVEASWSVTQRMRYVAFLTGVRRVRRGHRTTALSQLHRPPGFRLLAVAEFLCSRRTYEEVFLPTVQDLREEHAAALVAGREWKARWVLLRGYWSFISAAGLQSAVRFARRALKMWSSAP